ncbi:zinc finger, C3HC4 type (RING finger) domain containing protein [Entamoeba nuttalli P19]|uniref:Zinc finger, C3HC4 type (RING finger) domain containing protein n=1 Tax=Entamoeba nuttalli (strain P19) TaxID=1076696 RepID=K2GJT0_ENTNP|nr:zinc finger, C3HC4 type (RING finger) domain containing protein [Entamoeba nuttalli P19]EKE43051.1 zinc finger, C3HC4 type (RING finger) domain containing protein [Entamoeba nuttalli P19]|eukprot:XP_008854614.1 zinc finger, C3HC4 type (RING finger) domain containing protein [Entamoeba nuttalli P19]
MNEIQCNFCNKILNDPVTFSCGHSFCLVCVRQIFRKDNICPTCQKPFGRPFKVNEKMKIRIERFIEQQSLSAKTNESDECITNVQPNSSLLSLPEYTILEIMKVDIKCGCLLAQTCKKLNELFNRDSLWMDKVLSINPHFKHQIGASWKIEYFWLSSRRNCYIKGGINNYNVQTIFYSANQIHQVQVIDPSDILTVYDNQYLYEINLNNEINKIKLSGFKSISKIQRRANKLLILDNDTFYKYNLLTQSIICSYIPHNKIITTLMNERDFLITQHSILQMNDDGTFTEAVFPNMDIVDAMFYNKNIVLIGKEMDKNCVHVIDTSGKCIKVIEFDNPITLVDGWRMVDNNNQLIYINKSVVYCGNEMWIPGEDNIKDNESYSTIKIKKRDYDIVICIHSNFIQINDQTFEIDIETNDWYVDELNERIILVDFNQRKALVVSFNDGVLFSIILGSDSEIVRGIIVNLFEYKLYVILDKSVRVLQFGN